MQIIGEILTLYAKSQGAVPADTELVPVDVSKLPLRRKIGWPLGSYLRNFFHSKISAWQLAVGEPIPLFDHQPAKRGDECGIYPFLQSFDLTQEETKAYLKKAKSLNVTVNDLMLFHLFTAMEEWRALSGKSIPKGKSRLMVPTNLRQPHHEGMPAANIVSAIFLDRTAKQVNGDPEKLLKGIHREMEWAKKHDQKYIFTVALRVLMTVPGLLKYTLKYPKCRSTGVLSNLGRIWEKSPIPRNAEGKIQIGENVVEFIDAAPPIRSRTMFAYSAMTYAGALRLCMRYDHRFISTSEAENFLEIFKKKLTEN